MSRTTRAGNTFNPYTLGQPFICDIDAEDLLRRRFAELDAMDQMDPEERDEDLESEDETRNDAPEIAKTLQLESFVLSQPSVPKSTKSTRPHPPPLEIPHTTTPSRSPEPLSPLTPLSALSTPVSSSFPLPCACNASTSNGPPLNTPPPSIPSDNSDSSASSAARPNSPSSKTQQPSPPLRGKKARQRGSHQRRAQKRREQAEAADEMKDSTRLHVADAMDHIMQFDVDAGDLPVNSSGFGGLRQSLAKDRRDADALCAQPGWYHLRYEGRGSIPLVDRKRRMIACIGGTPKDVARWTQEVVEPLAEAIEKGSRGVKFSQKEKKHKRGGFPATAVGVSHGGGEKRPGNRRLSKSARIFMQGLLANQAMRRASGFLNHLFRTYNRPMYDVYEAHQIQLHAKYPHLRKNFDNSVFSCLTVNSGPQTVTDPHVDSANKPDGWCGITCAGPFNYKRGGQLVLWDLKLVIDFPPGCTIFIPSALLVHSNCPIQPGEQRYSWTQYTAGGLFRWVANGFQKQEDFLHHASDDEREQWWADRELRWQRGLQLFPVLP